MNYKHFGVMLDCSRNAVMKVEKLKYLIDCLRKMEYNTLELYMEDTYELEGELHFGYLRGRYSKSEIKEIDAYAKEHGIELIPCIQTLAHFTAIDERVYADMIDMGDVLLVDEPKTYAFIEKIFKTLSESFTSRNVNIGMDEALMLGRGKYLDKYGACNKTEVLLRHLKKVAAIAEKYGFKTHMWSDMFFRLVNNGEYYESNAPIVSEINTMIPSNVDLCYWDYYHTEKEVYDAMLSKHKQFNCEVWFAGGAWTWNGFAPFAQFTLKSMLPAMQSVLENNISNVLITMWGDNGAECSIFSQLHSLYAIREFSKGNFDMDQIKMGFENLFGVKYDDFMLLDIPNMRDFNTEQKSMQGIPEGMCKTLLYMDPFMGIFDNAVQKMGTIPYAAYAEDLRQAAGRVKEFAYIFNELAALCEVLSIKADLGVKTRKAYRQKDKKALEELICEYKKVSELLYTFHKEFYLLWHKENKTFGWEIQDARLGGLIRRINTCAYRLQAYLLGEMDEIEELEEEILSVENDDNINYNCYIKLISRSLL